MIGNYLTTMIRHVRRHPGFSALSVLNLAIGLLAFLLIALLIREETSYDSFLPDAGRIYRVAKVVKIGERRIESPPTPGPPAQPSPPTTRRSRAPPACSSRCRAAGAPRRRPVPGAGDRLHRRQLLRRPRLPAALGRPGAGPGGAVRRRPLRRDGAQVLRRREPGRPDPRHREIDLHRPGRPGRSAARDPPALRLPGDHRQPAPGPLGRLLAGQQLLHLRQAASPTPGRAPSARPCPG